MPTHFTINLNKPNIRFFYFYFVENSEIHIPIIPKHIWQNVDPATFNNYDLSAGWPVGTGPYVLVDASGQAAAVRPQRQLVGRQDRLPEPAQAAARDLHPARRRRYGRRARDQQRLRRGRHHAARRLRSRARSQSQHRQLEHLRAIVGRAGRLPLYARPEHPLWSDRRHARAPSDQPRDQPHRSSSTWPTKARRSRGWSRSPRMAAWPRTRRSCSPSSTSTSPTIPDPSQVAVEHAGSRLYKGRRRLLGQGRHRAGPSISRRRAG